MWKKDKEIIASLTKFGTMIRVGEIVELMEDGRKVRIFYKNARMSEILCDNSVQAHFTFSALREAMMKNNDVEFIDEE